MLNIESIPLLNDNYAYVLCDQATGTVAVIDPSQAQPIITYLNAHNLPLHYILNTHHHWDHTDGNLTLKEATGAKVIGSHYDAHRIRGIDITVKEGDSCRVGESVAEILFIPGHTTGHIAFYFKEDHSVFCGDTLFSLGCGRLFEGTAEQMYKSLMKLATLPEETKLYCGHEYTLANGRFALTIEPDNPALQLRIAEATHLRNQGKPTIPSTIGQEKATNPFLRVHNAEEFAYLRKRKDGF